MAIFKKVIDVYCDAKAENGFDAKEVEKKRKSYKEKPALLRSLFFTVEKIYKYRDEGIQYETKSVRDEDGIRQKIDSLIEKTEFDKWVENLYAGLVKGTGIANGKEYLTASGNRRTFRQTHYDVTPENIVKSMKSQVKDDKTAASFLGIKTLRAAASESFNSVDEMHKKSDHLKLLDKQEYMQRENRLNERLFAAINSIAEKTNSSTFFSTDNIGEIIQEAASKKNFTEKNAEKYF